jgi:hypothetical protein
LGSVLHGGAHTTPRIRAELQASSWQQDSSGLSQPGLARLRHKVTILRAKKVQKIRQIPALKILSVRETSRQRQRFLYAGHDSESGAGLLGRSA